MEDNPKDSLKDLWKEETGVRKEAQRWQSLANAGFIGLVGTEAAQFLTKKNEGKHAWRLPLFIASGASVVIGVVMNWVKGNKAEAMRESLLMIEHTPSEKKSSAEAVGQWSSEIAMQKDTPPTISK